MKNNFKYLAFASLVFAICSCDGIFEPLNENLIDEAYVTTDPASAEGLMLNAYSNVISQYTFTDVATDDAVHNQLGNGYRRMAAGELTAIYNPLNRWNQYANVFYVNKFLQVVDKIVWMKDAKGYSIQNELYKKRLRGEALALRALHHSYVLENFAGKDNSGNLMGIPYYTEVIEPNGNFNIPRLTFEQTVEKIQADYDSAFNLLPTIYSNKTTDIPTKDAPSKSSYMGTDWAADSAYYMTNYNSSYTVVNGANFNLRLSGKIVRALQARLKLFASSKAYLDSEAGYKEAANYATELLTGYTLNNSGLEFYNDDADKSNVEILWRQTVSLNSYSLEQNNFPPSLNGKGNINPTQNFVDAFYMKDGYPIGQSPTNVYDPQSPYANRDSRLDKYIVYNGGKILANTINTTATDTKNGVNAVPEQSTRTGYYLKKLLRQDVVIPASGTPVGKNHFNVYFRYTELYLILAESQNEIGGPDYKEGTSTLSARDIMRLIRKRAMSLSTDPYLDGIANQEDMRKLIQNERRLELCFEGFRFWDLRRWGLPLNESVKGLYDDATGAGYQLIDVESRAFNDEKHRYLPLPYNEVRKYTNLIQNAGW